MTDIGDITEIYMYIEIWDPCTIIWHVLSVLRNKDNCKMGNTKNKYITDLWKPVFEKLKCIKDRSNLWWQVWKDKLF